LKLLSIKINNFRAFLGEHEIEFAHTKDENVTILIAENEVGKSSLLNAILWCFYGELTEDTDRPEDLIHDDAKSKLVEVEVRLIEKDKEYLFKRLDRNGTEAFKAFEMQDNGELGRKINFPETLIESFLPKVLSNYFLFNGEGLKDIVQDSVLLNKSVQDIQGLSAAREALEKIKDFKLNLGRTLHRNKEASAAKKNYESKIEGLMANIEEETRKLDSQKNKVSQAKKESSDADKAWQKVANKSATSLHEQRKKAEKELNGQISMLANAKKSKALHIRAYGIDILGFPFSGDTENILAESDEKGYPSKFEKTMIEDSLRECLCQLCETELPKNSDTYKKIKEKLDMAIDDDLKDRVSKARSSLTSMKNIIQTYGDASEAIDETINKIEETISKKRESIKDIKAEILKLAKHETEIRSAEERRTKANAELTKQTTNESLIKNNITSLSNDIRDMKSKLPNSNEDDSLKNEFDFLDEVCDYLDETINTSEKSARDYIFTDMNESLKIHSKGNHEFRFREETFEPVIIKSDGKLLKLSTGAKKLKRNLFFVTSLIKHSKMRAKADGDFTIPGTVAPLIVDAPFTELDIYNQKIAGRVMLESTDQLILMVDSATFNNGILEVIDENPEHRNRIGEVYCLIRHLVGKQGDKANVKMKVFDQHINSTLYDKKFDETKILKVDF
jgi:DNA sulfur modification protein DndD